MTIQERTASDGITMKARPTDANPNMADSADMDHWRVTLRHVGRSMTLTFSMGSGHNGAEPQAAEVLGCLLSDYTGFCNCADFAEWAREYGYDVDSRKAERIYKNVRRQSVKLANFLGGQLEAYAYETECL